MNLAYLNPHNLKLAAYQLHGTSFPQLSSLSIPVDGMMVQPFTGGVDQWQFEPLLFLSSLTFFTQKMYFRSFLKLNSYFKIFFIIFPFNCCCTSLSLVYLNYLVKRSLVKPTRRTVVKQSQNNTNN